MENPIKDNRIVSNITFAVRLKSFAEGVTCADACSEDEKESIIHIAEKLLKYQLASVDSSNTEEVNYLTRLGLYPVKPLLETHDGAQIYESVDGSILFSCMSEPGKGDQVLRHVIKTKSDLDRINQKRLLFWGHQCAKTYLDENIKVFSIQDLKNNNLYAAYESQQPKR